ncbi:imelysin family protein [Maribacter sp. 2210JD10-5]|uniref:imelysin family protein n=1 Tax=Maribacter sp. 2210JD10-5 TaxID=3386272 RepID=UPI0039BC8FF5
MKKILGILFLTTIFWACSSDNGGGGEITDDGPTPVSFQRGPMLANWADNIIIPSYEAFSAEMESLNTAFSSFKADASVSNLTALRSSWLSAYKVWQSVSMYEIGPAETVGLRLNMNIYPTDASKIEGHIASGSYDLSLSSNRDAKGFPALDYLINGLGEDDATIAAKYNDTDKEALIAYAEAVLEDMTTLTNQVVAEWSQGYRDTFVNNDGASATASVDRFVNDYIFYYEKFLRAGKMGIPLGVFSGTKFPEKVEAFYKSDVSNELFLEGLNAVQDFFNGKHFGKTTSGVSLASYLDDLNSVKDGEDLKQLINNQFNEARSAVTGLGSFREEIQNNSPATQMLLAYDEVQRAVPLLKVDMVSAMSISIDFVDADGD